MSSLDTVKRVEKRFLFRISNEDAIFSDILVTGLSQVGGAFLPRLRSRSRKKSEVFGWGWIPKNTGSRSRIFLSDSGNLSESFLHHTPTLGIPVEMVQFLWKLLFKQRILAVHHNFH